MPTMAISAKRNIGIPTARPRPTRPRFRTGAPLRRACQPSRLGCIMDLLRSRLGRCCARTVRLPPAGGVRIVACELPFSSIAAVNVVSTPNDLLAELTWRGLIAEQSQGLPERLAKGPISAYIGFDASATSLHVGHLLQVFMLTHLQRAGGTPFVIIGGGTGMVGDPSGKSTERNLLDDEQIAANSAHRSAASWSASSTSRRDRTRRRWSTTANGCSIGGCSTSCATSASTFPCRTCSPRTQFSSGWPVACRSPSSRT